MIKKDKKLLSLLRLPLLCIVAAVIGMNVYSWNASRLSGNSVPMPFGVGAAVVLSGSMEPEFSVGDLLVITESEAYAVGDVVVYQDGRMAITHRIVAITEDEIITRGDANNVDDDPITLAHIKGKVRFAVPLVGHLINAIKSPIGTLCILGLAIFLLEGSFRTKKQQDTQALEEIKAEIERLKQQQNNS